MTRPPRRRRYGLDLALVVALVPGSTGTARGIEPVPPRERDCMRWAEASWTSRPAVETPSAASGVPSAYADRVPNPDPMLAVGRRATTLELLLCEQLNVKDKLDWLIRRLGR